MSGWAAAVCSKREITRLGSASRPTEIEISILRCRFESVQLVSRSDISFPFGHDDFGAVERADDAGANADVFYQSRGVVDLNHVSNVDGTLEKQNQAGDKIIKDVLQSESNSNTECTGKNRDSRHINP